MTLTLLVGIVGGLILQAFLLPTNALAAPPAPGVVTPLVLPDYAVQIDNARTGVSGVCFLCSVSGTAHVIDSDIANNGTIYLTVGLGTSGAIAVRDTANSYSAGYFAGFVLSSGGLLDAQVLNALTISTYKSGTFQESRQAGALLTASIGGGNAKSLVGFVTTLPFDEIRVSVASLVAVAVNLDVHYAAVASVPPAPTIAAPTSGSALSTTLPTIGGTAAASSIVTVKAGVVTICSATTSAAGAWSCSPAAALSQGSYSIVATATNVAGTSPASPVVQFTVDTIAPAAPAIAVPLQSSIGNSATPTISGTAEANSNVSVYRSGVSICTASASAGGAWACAPSAALPEGSQNISAAATDAAGNTGPASPVRSFTIDSIAPPAPTISSPASGGSVNTATPSISGSAEPASSVTVQVDGATQCTVTADAGGAWSCTPAALSEGGHTIGVTATDAAGNSSAPASSSFTINTAAVSTPSIITPVAGASVATTTPSIGGIADAGTTVTVREGGAAICSATTAGNGQWSCAPATPLSQGSHTILVNAVNGVGTASSSAARTFIVDTTPPGAPVLNSPAPGSLSATATPTFEGTAEPGSSVAVSADGAVVCTALADANGAWSCTPISALAEGSHTIAAVATDAAGNVGPASPDRSLVVDTLAPAAPQIVNPAAGAITNDAYVPFSGTAEANSTVAVRDGGATLCVATAGPSGAWNCIPATALSEGAHLATATATDAAGNASPASAPRGFSVDLTAPPAPTVSAPAAGASTSDTTPTFSGTAEPATTITVSEGGATLCTTTADGNGAWSCTPAAPLAEGPHTASVVSADAAGNRSPAATRAFVVDTTAPAPPTASSPADGGIINTSSPVFSGTAEPGSTITVREGGTTLCTATAGSNGAWSCTPAAPLSQGVHTVSIVSTDPAGNTSAAINLSFEINAAAVSTPSILTPTTGAHLNTATPTFSGTADAGTTVKVDEGASTLCSATTNGSGAWSCVSTVTLAEGAHTVNAVATNGASTASSPATRSFVVDLTAPAAAPTISSPAAGSTSANPNLSIGGGNAEANSSVIVSEGANTICVATASAGGAWSCTPDAPLGDGAHTIQAAAADLAGNSGPNSAPRTFSVDTRAPEAPTLTAPAASALTNDATPAFSGVAEPGSTIAVREGGATLCTATADSNGAWACSPGVDLGAGGHTITVSATDAAGNASPSSPPRSFTIDLSAPVAPTIIDPPAGATLNTSSPTFAGTAEALSAVTVSEGGATLCVATADANGAWNCTSTTALSEGNHTASAIAADRAGNGSAPASRAFAIDTTAPAAPVISAPAANTATNSTNPAFSGTAEPGSVETASEGSATLCIVTADSNGAWRCVPAAPLADGAHTIRVTATDPSGNTSPATTRSLVVDTVAPADLAIVSPAAGTAVDSTTPMFDGTAEPDASVTIAEGQATLCAAKADGAGRWSCASTTALAVGAHTISAIEADPAGNVSAPQARTFSVRAGAMFITIISPLQGSMIADRTPVITGEATAGSTVQVTIAWAGAQLRYTTTADAQGQWQIDLDTATPTEGTLPVGGLPSGQPMQISASATLSGRAPASAETITVRSGWMIFLPLIQR